MKEGGREGGKDGVKEGGREGGSEGGKEGGREGVKEGGRDSEILKERERGRRILPSFSPPRTAHLEVAGQVSDLHVQVVPHLFL